ncbi:MAG: dihydrolipoyl dehydrogenase [Gammaproteobacteria bacterium]
MSEQYDVIVIGAGPAGYVAAIRCAQNGLKTACVDNWLDPDGKPSPGGTCLNVGCIPSKALLDSSEKYYELLNHGADYGIKASGLEIDVSAMMARKESIVKELTGGIQTLFKGNGVTWIPGTGRVLEGRKVKVEKVDGGEMELTATSVVLAAGSRPMEIPPAPTDGERIVDSSGALSFPEVPKKLAVIGGGIIGLELGSVWNRLGSKVTVLEAQDQFLPMLDSRVSASALRQFKKQGLDIHLGARVLEAKATAKQVTVHYSTLQGEHKIKVDHVLVAVGRVPNTDHLIDPSAEIEVDERGFVVVDEQCMTSAPGVYAIGDLVAGPMLAHKGSEEGVMVADIIAGGTGHVNYDLIPNVVYTNPEIAWVGKTDAELKSAGEKVATGQFPLAANGRAKIHGDQGGMIRIHAHEETDQILGVHIIGPHASELIAEAVLAMEYGASAEDIALTCHAHPTVSEAMHEAALAVSGQALHMVNK